MAPAARWLDPWRERPAVEAIWRALAEACRPTYFLTWPWVEIWLKTIPTDSAVRLIVVEDEAGPRAAWFLGRRSVRRARVVPSAALFLNATGWPELDDLTIEHNAWLVRPGARCAIEDVVAAIPPDWTWDELELAAMDASAAQLAPAGDDRLIVGRVSACPTVDLARVRDAGDYLALLGRDTRAQIRRARKLYDERGERVTQIASDLPAARAIFEELCALHAATWQRRGQAGAFSPYLTRFHARLIDERFAHDEIQLVRVAAGGVTIGCIYNFVLDGIVTFYQSGLAHHADNRFKPGLVCHAEAIAASAAAGHRIYDFLGGDSRYKRSLATDLGELTWGIVQRPRRRLVAIERARALRAWWRARRTG